MMHRTFTVVGVTVALLPWPAGAQERIDGTPETLPPPSAYLGLSLQVGQARGQFADYVDYGGGGGAYLVYRPNRRGPFGVRLDLMYLNYGSQTHSYPLVPGIVVDVTTDNQIFQIALGPQLTIGQGALQAYGFGTFGGSFFSTTSGVEGSDQNNQQFASTTNHSDATFSSEFGGGVLVRLSRGPPVLLDIGARYLKNGRVTYVTKDGVTISGNQLLVNPVNSDANLIVYHLGVSIGARRGSGGESP
jgi:hypothetical protein